ncbi:carbohydrate ABC transporter permease [Actinoplanes sp. NPDC049265]|uniref:carbohydrate ABC transporter permease n=1 Tax=Actinoplanes sp. NPDC049265 TaxID=3363902 RepID=UPI00371FEA60
MSQTLAPPPAAAPALKKKTKPTADLTAPGRGPLRFAVYLVLLIVALAFLLPFLWLVVASIQPGAALSAKVTWDFSFENFAKVLNVETLFRPVLNSLIISGGTALITVVAATFAAYPLSRYRSRFGRMFLYGILFSTGLPITGVMVPVYTMYSRFELTDSVPALILFMSATALPFAIWMMKNFMDGVPVELEEAAWTDGAGWFQSLWRIILPLMVPGLTVVFVFTFVGQWGNFFIPFILLQTPESQPASVTIYTFFSTYGQVAYGQLAAFAILYTAPVVLLYSALSRVFGGAFSLAGAVKG